MKKVMAIAMLAAITFCIGCSKYEDGPVASLLTKKQRITGKYDVESWDTEGEILIDLDDLEIEFFKDNSVKVQFIEDGVVRTQQGEWSFASDKEQLRLKWEDGITDYVEILKLTNKEFWYMDEDNSEAHLVKR